jgi:predicted enzyme related to lactoylglutathione lyase
MTGKTAEIEIIKYILWVNKIDRAIAFYRDALGFRVGLRRDDWCELHHEGSLVGLHAGGNEGRTKTGLCIQVPKIELACKTITSSGGRILEQPHPLDSKDMSYALATDTEGNELMITQVLQ